MQLTIIKKFKRALTEMKTIAYSLTIIIVLFIGIACIDLYQGYSWNMIMKTFTHELKTSSMNDLFSMSIFLILIIIYLYVTSVKSDKKKS
ncbi:hypothetical protein [Metabacillus sp. 84]|uniref:hypothetical protein n=1 Tax=unclassified Metabacillus TaxID=2675274 RepID=UPI003CF5B0D3